MSKELKLIQTVLNRPPFNTQHYNTKSPIDLDLDLDLNHVMYEKHACDVVVESSVRSNTGHRTTCCHKKTVKHGPLRMNLSLDEIYAC